MAIKDLEHDSQLYQDFNFLDALQQDFVNRSAEYAQKITEIHARMIANPSYEKTDPSEKTYFAELETSAIEAKKAAESPKIPDLIENVDDNPVDAPVDEPEDIPVDNP